MARAAAAITLVVAAAACGSTARPPEPAAARAGPAAPDELRLEAGTDAGTHPGSPAALDVVPVRGRTPGAGPAPGIGAPAPAAPGGRSCPPADPEANGVTDDEIVIGATTLHESLFVKTALPEHRADEYMDVFVDELNERGGLACRRVRVVWVELDLANAFAAHEEEMCAAWTQDNEVLVAVPVTTGAGEVVYPCLDEAGVLTFDIAGKVQLDRETLASLPNVRVLNGPDLTRSATAQVDAHVRTGLLTERSRIGVVHYDDVTTTNAVEDGIEAALARHGLALTERVAVAPSAEGRQQALPSAVMRFKAARIDRVLIVRSANLAKEFMLNASSGRYFPRYGLTTVEMDAVIDKDTPREQLRNAVGIGWLPDSDLYPARPEPWPSMLACARFFADRGYDLPTVNDRRFAMSVCDLFGVLQAAVDAAPLPLSVPNLLSGLAALGTSHESPVVRATNFTRPDAIHSYVDAVFDEEKDGFVYRGGPHPFP